MQKIILLISLSVPNFSSCMLQLFKHKRIISSFVNSSSRDTITKNSSNVKNLSKLISRNYLVLKKLTNLELEKLYHKPIQQISQETSKNLINKNLSIAVHSNKLPLPKEMRSLPITYEKVKQIDGWTCGYNVLYNACVLEKRFGLKQPNASWENFFDICLPYVQSCNLLPLHATTVDMLADISKLLNLSSCHFLGIDKIGQVDYVLTEMTRSKKTQELKGFLANNENKTVLLHFVCHLVCNGISHVILISLVQDTNGKKHFYINDNMNAPIDENSEAKKYITYLYKNLL